LISSEVSHGDKMEVGKSLDWWEAVADADVLEGDGVDNAWHMLWPCWGTVLAERLTDMFSIMTV
jgi:hypothetical protein